MNFITELNLQTNLMTSYKWTLKTQFKKQKKLPVKLNLTRIDTIEQLRIIDLG